MTGKKKVKPRNLSTKKKKKIPIISAVDVDAELEIRDVHELREGKKKIAPQF